MRLSCLRLGAPLQVMQDLVAPLQGSVAIDWHLPRDGGRASTAVTISLGDVVAQPSFLHVPALQAALHHLQASLLQCRVVKRACPAELALTSMFGLAGMGLKTLDCSLSHWIASGQVD